MVKYEFKNTRNIQKLDNNIQFVFMFVIRWNDEHFQYVLLVFFYKNFESHFSCTKITAVGSHHGTMLGKI